MSENLKLTDPDIVEMDFPPYVEEYSPFPDVETDFNFEDNKEEIYLRNRIIAANEQVKLLKEEERKRLEKQEQFREMTEAAKAADRTVRTAKKKRNWDKLILLDSIIVVFGIIALIVALSGRTSKPSSYDLSYEESSNNVLAEMRSTETTMVVSKKETEAAAQVSREPIVTEITEEIIEEEETEAVEEPVEDYATETEINDEILKTTAVREPFEEDGSSYIYNTAAMSYKFTPMYTETQYGQTSLSIYVTVKNLTDYNYAIVPNFVIDNNGDLTRASVNESSSSMNSSYAEQLADGEWVKTDTQFIAYDFDKNHLCSFRLQFLYRETTGVFSFAPSSRISREYSEKSDVDFQIPLEEILKYI